MRTIEAIDRDLAEARDELEHVEGSPAEVYSRIVGYYRSVRNWNKGKREEYDERKLYDISEEKIAEKKEQEAPALRLVPQEETVVCVPEKVPHTNKITMREPRVLLFVRQTCPSCPSAKDAAGDLGIPVDTVNADTELGLREAGRRNVFSTPTAILLSKDGKEITRAMDSAGIRAFEELLAG